MWKYRIFLEADSEADLSQTDLRVFARGLHRTVINWFNSQDTVLTDKIKEANHLRPFNISFLRFDKEQKLYLFEISIIDEKMPINKLLEAALTSSQETKEILDLNYFKFKVKKWNLLIAKNYLDLLETANNKKEFKSVKLEFISETTFVKKTQHRSKIALTHPLPDLELFFESIVNRWNTFCMSKFSVEEVVEYVKENAYITGANIKTDNFSLGYAKQMPIIVTGFKGYITFDQTGNDVIWDSIIKTLLLYSSWSGVGKKNAFGLGQTRVHFFNSR